jgi:hypothetical protein
LESKTQQVDALLAVNGEAGEFPTDFEGARNRRYSIDFPFEPQTFQPLERSVNVDQGTIFRCAYIESFVRAVGTKADPYSGDDVTGQVTMSWNDRLQSFDYFCRVRDTGTDREWFDQPQPALFCGGGYWGPLWLPRRVVMSGGSIIYGSVEPFRNSLGSDFFFFNGIVSQYVVQMSFVGHEISDRSAP